MKKAIILISLVLILSNQAAAQYSGFLASPRTMPNGSSKAGAYIGIYDHALGILGQYRYGVGGYTDIGLKLGVIDLDRNHGDNAGADVAFDLKYQLLERKMRDPIELSLGGVSEFFVVEDLNVFSLMFALSGSYPVALKNGRELEPYARLTMGAERTSDGVDDTDFEIGFNMGANFELSSSVDALAEFQFDEPFTFFLGLNFDL